VVAAQLALTVAVVVQVDFVLLLQQQAVVEL
jgi:hypothetical protein